MVIILFFPLSNQRLELHHFSAATQASAQPPGALWHRNNAASLLAGWHCLPFLVFCFFSSEVDKAGWGSLGVSLQWIAFFLSGSRHRLIFKSPMLTLAHPLFLLAGQALYYSGKSVCVRNRCVCVCVCEAKFQALAAHRQTCRCRDAEEEEGTSSQNCAWSFSPRSKKAIRGRVASPRILPQPLPRPCRSITLPITDVICH